MVKSLVSGPISAECSQWIRTNLLLKCNRLLDQKSYKLNKYEFDTLHSIRVQLVNGRTPSFEQIRFVGELNYRYQRVIRAGKIHGPILAV